MARRTGPTRAEITGYDEVVAAFGDVKTIEDWVKDIRCLVSAPVLRQRIRRGMDGAKAMSMADVAQAFIPKRITQPVTTRLIEAFGETKTAGEWAEDPRCNVSAATIIHRIERGVSTEDAILRARSRGRQAGMTNRTRRSSTPGQLMHAFGESKTLMQWTEDERCAVHEWTLRQRLRSGWETERAISAPAGTFGRGRAAQTYEAFGETKTPEEWSMDPRCVVGKSCLLGRIDRGWELERSLTTPNINAPPTPTYLEAFGERKRLGAWMRDPRCSVSDSTITERLRRGWTPEEAVSTPPLGPGADHHGPPLQITAFGETKGTAAWADDPRCHVSQFTVWQRISRGMQPELAITMPSERGVYRMTADGGIEYTSPLLTAWGETKTAAEWSRDPRCQVSRNSILYRIRKGMPGEDVLTAENPKGALPPITAFGETKTAKQWVADPRMRVNYSTFCSRIRQGVDSERAMTAVHVRKNMRYIEAWGESKLAVEWSRDPRCSVASSVLWRRLQAWPDASPEQIVSLPARFTHRFGHGKIIEGFGETKSLWDWLNDARRKVPRLTVLRRIAQGWPLEEAMTMGMHERKKYLGTPAKLHEAFGEQKKRREWAADPRCVVSYSLICKRLKGGWDLETAITTPRAKPDFAKGRHHVDRRTLRFTAFGETRTAREWSEDPRCSMKAEEIVRRIKQGWTPEDAITLPPQKGGISHTGKIPIPKNSIVITAWGESKYLPEWGRDPRTKVSNDQLRNRIRRGWPPEIAISKPPGRGGEHYDGRHRATVPAKLYEAFGESKSLPDWAKDPRCVVRENNLYRRVQKGWPIEDAITMRADSSAKNPTLAATRTPQGRSITAWGETKKLRQWLDDPRVKVKKGTVALRLGRGWTPEDALSTPPVPQGSVGPGREKHKNYGPPHEAFGESKSLAEWAEDPRCVAPYHTIHSRLNRGWRLEDALLTPPLAQGRVGPGVDRPDHAGQQYAAFGERKSASEWVGDSRCVVTYSALLSRLKSGWRTEDAIQTPPLAHGLVGPGRVKVKNYGPRYEAFGESKTAAEWAEDPRCAVAYTALSHRLKGGWRVEDAIQTPRLPQGEVRPGWEKPKRYGKQHEGFGEKKSLAEWAADPRCVVPYHSIHARLKRGWKLEDALQTPALLPGLVGPGKKRPKQYGQLHEAFGEKKSAVEWAKDPRCVVVYPALTSRLRHGWGVEDALLTPPVAKGQVGPGTKKAKRYGNRHEAFGESKFAIEWAEDERCAVSYGALLSRLVKGWRVEDALLTPALPLGQVGPGTKKAKRYGRQHEAFGECKYAVEWAEDPRCVIGYATLIGRLRKGWSIEDALLTPPLPHGHVGPGTKKAKHYGKRYEAFGESKYTAEWVEDERCVVAYNTLQYRLRIGWPVEKALTFPSKRIHEVPVKG